jgi:hypothetical protein
MACRHPSHVVRGNAGYIAVALGVDPSGIARSRRFGTVCVGAMTERVLWRRLRSSYGNAGGVMSYEEVRV